MNILVVGRKYEESFANHIADTLKNMGHHVFIYEPGIRSKIATNKVHYRWLQAKTHIQHIYGMTSFGYHSQQEKLLTFAKEKSIDILISCHDFLTPAQLSALKKQNHCTTVLWFPDAISNFGKAMFLDADYDFLFFKEPFVIKVLNNELNKKAYYLPECCNPTAHYPVSLSVEDVAKYKCQLTTAGNMHTARSAFFKLLHSYDVKIWGNPAPIWMDTRGIDKMIKHSYVSNEEKSKAFNAASIVINTMHPTEIHGLNVRTFEIAATGGFQLINYREGIKDVFEINDEMVTFSTVAELHAKIKYYLENSADRKSIAAKAHKRAYADHTYKKRLQTLFDTIDGKAKGYPSILL